MNGSMIVRWPQNSHGFQNRMRNKGASASVRECLEHREHKWVWVITSGRNLREVEMEDLHALLNLLEEMHLSHRGEDIRFRKIESSGFEAVGVVTAVGPGLTGMKEGDIVAYAENPMGSYTQEQILTASVAVRVPPSIDPIVAASIMLKGLTAQFLVRRCFKVEPGHTILVHAAAGGVGSLLCQWAHALGATVIGTVSTEAKAAQASKDGCHHVIIYSQEDFVSRVDEITSGEGVNVVYDSVGKDTFQGSLACLKTRGYMVNFGQSSGMPDPVPLSALAAKSLFLTRPSLMQYNATRNELLEAAGELFASIASGMLKVPVNHTYPLSQAAQAHADLEARKTTGSVVLIPDSD
ncbi:uncharacterized protein LOC131248234 isoform X1 [Magnolia sinica]|uniref:uncharacterized protein LOC131248234 isoform X1 n=1 Tax=Magnolia sinica TaxID=86752 RepID=UPI002659948C|nr:uncharacterized protein LOC131248234 isoform X1 [Magnolia sinica]